MIKSDLRSRTRDYLDRSDLDTKIDGWINDVRLDLALKYNFRYLYVESTASTTAGESTYSLPADYLGHLVLWCGSKKLMRVSPRELDNLTETDINAGASVRLLPLESGSSVSSTSISAPPDYYIERGMEVELYPTPDAVYTLTLKYYAQPATWATGSSTNDSYDYITTFHPEAVIWGVALRGAMYLDDDKKIPVFAAAYKSAVEEMIARERANLVEDQNIRIKTWTDFDLTTFKRMFRVGV